jgi:hypothetical protein
MSDVEEFVEYTHIFIYDSLLGMHEQQLSTAGGFLTFTI